VGAQENKGIITKPLGGFVGCFAERETLLLAKSGILSAERYAAAGGIQLTVVECSKREGDVWRVCMQRLVVGCESDGGREQVASTKLSECVLGEIWHLQS
jgi:hypothetical protein